MRDITFGTDGWRSEIAKGFTFDNVRRLSQAIAGYLNAIRNTPLDYARDRHDPLKLLRSNGAGARRIIVGYDTRFMSDIYAKLVSEVLAANNIQVLLVREPTPTPAVSFAIRSRGLDGGVIITASHNPPLFNGIKLKTSLATSADEATTKRIESLIGRNKVKVTEFDKAVSTGRIKYMDVAGDYVGFIRKYVDIDRIKRARPKVLIDYMHGAGAGYIESALGKPWPGVEAVRTEQDPLFGGVSPEPIPKNLKSTSGCVKKGSFDICVALDGDADRIGALRPNGTFLTSGQIISLILLHLLENRNLRGCVVKTISGTTLIEDICKSHNLTMFETPVGFKHISALMLQENILIGGEESGGIGFCGYIPERDGILSALLLLEMLAWKREGIDSIMRGIDRRYGRFYYDRLDIRYPVKRMRLLTKKFKSNPPRMIAGKRPVKLKTYDGIKFIFADSSWLLLRFSGTEPLIRIYAEAGSRKDVQLLLEGGRRIIR